MQRGDIVLVPFPQTDLAAGKYRPTLVIALTPEKYEDVLLMQITSREQQLVPGFFVTLAENTPEFYLTGLKVTSHVRITRLATVARTMIVGKLGRVSDRTFAEVREKLARWLGHD